MRPAERRGLSNSVPWSARRSSYPLPSGFRDGPPGNRTDPPACTSRKEILPQGGSTEGWRCPIPARREYARVRYCVPRESIRAAAPQSVRGLVAPPESARAPRTTLEHPRIRRSELFLPVLACQATLKLLRQG